MLNYVNLPHKVRVGNKYVGEGEPAFFIAEIGNNHNGDYYLAKKSIEEAVKAGADAVKFQKRFIDEVFAKELRDKPQTKDQIYGSTYGEYRKNLELDEEEFRHLKQYCDSLGAIFFATPFDKKSADFLENIGLEVYKIASFDVTNTPLLEYVARKGKPMFLSVGMSTLEEMDLAVSTILKFNNQLIIKHCVSVYPTPDEKNNLANLRMLQERYSPLPVGYSGHEKGILPSLSAICLGAKSVERHFTLNKSLPGPDHATVSIEPEEFRRMVYGARRIEKMIGMSDKKILEDEQKTRDKHSKSLVTRKILLAGTTLTEDMIAFKSPGYGIKPYRLNEVIGKRIKVDLSGDSVITDNHIEW